MTSKAVIQHLLLVVDGSQDGKKDMVFVNSLLQARYHPRMLKGATILKLLKIEKAKGKKRLSYTSLLFQCFGVSSKPRILKNVIFNTLPVL